MNNVKQNMTAWVARLQLPAARLLSFNTIPLIRVTDGFHIPIASVFHTWKYYLVYLQVAFSQSAGKG